jgi:hypothetical protein
MTNEIEFRVITRDEWEIIQQRFYNYSSTDYTSASAKLVGALHPYIPNLKDYLEHIYTTKIDNINVRKVWNAIEPTLPVNFIKLMEDSDEYSNGIMYPVSDTFKQSIPIMKAMAKTLMTYINTKGVSGCNLCFRGSSGCIIATYVGTKLIGEGFNVTFHYFSKDGEYRHTCSDTAEYVYGYNVIIDDFISSGSTARVIHHNMRAVRNPIIVCVSATYVVTRLSFIPEAIIANNLQMFEI